jgi:hypothetical protein
MMWVVGVRMGGGHCGESARLEQVDAALCGMRCGVVLWYGVAVQDVLLL